MMRRDRDQRVKQFVLGLPTGLSNAVIAHEHKPMTNADIQPT